jgi:hypothetical protein
MVLFLGRLLPGEAVPPVTDGLDEEGRCPPDAVVLRAQPGECHRQLHHAGPVVATLPARLIRIEHGPWGEPQHIGILVK